MITILGPTASGKTALATTLASQLGAEVISADSRQVYRHMDIGTGKDLDEYEVNGTRVKYHLIDIAEPGTKYNLFKYQKDFFSTYEEIIKRGVLPILCGGSGLYIEAVLKGYGLSPVPENRELRRSLEARSLPELTSMLIKLKRENGSNMHNTTDVDTVNRAIRAIEIETYNRNNPELERRKYPEIHSLIIGINIDRDTRRRKISTRLKQRLDGGLVEEVKELLNMGIPAEDLIYYGLEYKFVTQYVIGEISYDEMFASLEIAIHQFAKRQMTWFRGMERRGLKINWLPASLATDEKISLVRKLYEDRLKL